MPTVQIRRSTCAALVTLAIALGVPTAAVAQSSSAHGTGERQTADPKQTVVSKEKAEPENTANRIHDRVAFKETAKNTYTFDHRDMRGWAGGGTMDMDFDPARLGVLEVKDGEFFQVKVVNTYAPCFTYTVTASDESRPDSTSQVPGEPRTVPQSELRPIAVTMRHHKAFQKYRVSITAKCRAGTAESREAAAEAVAEKSALSPDDRSKFLSMTRGLDKADLLSMREKDPRALGWIDALLARREAPPTVELREIAFDLWVLTAPTWKLMINGGVAFQAFESPQYFIATEKETADDGTTTETKLFKAGEPETQSRPAVMTLVTAFPPVRGWLRHLGPSVGFGGQDGDLRYYFGGAISLGDQLIFTAGRARGFINAPPLGQKLDAPPISDNVLANLRTQPASAWYFGFAWGFDMKSTSDAIASFTASATGTSPSEKPPAVSTFTGTYATEDSLITVSSDGIGVMVRTNTDDLALPVQKGKSFHEVAGGQSAEFEVAADAKVAKSVTLKLSGGEITAPRAKALSLFAGDYEGMSGAAIVSYKVAVSGLGLTVSTNGGAPAIFRRAGDAKFTGPAGEGLTFTVADDKATELKLGDVTAQRKAAD